MVTPKIIWTGPKIIWTGAVVDSLAAYRLTRLVVEDGITAGLRNRWWAKWDPEFTLTGYALTCPHCVGMWAAGIVLVLPRWVRYGLAMAAAVSLISDARQWLEVGTYAPEIDNVVNLDGPRS